MVFELMTLHDMLKQGVKKGYRAFSLSAHLPPHVQRVDNSI